MYAVFVKVRLDPARMDEITESLHEGLVPRTKQAPGFVRGTWFGDSTSGHSLTLFDSEEHAQQMAEMASTASDDPVQILDVTVYEVHADA